MQHDIKHGLEQQKAQEVAKRAVESYAKRFAQFSFEHTWVDDSRVNLSFAVMGKRLEGSLSVLADVLRFEMEVPLLMRVFSKKAVEIIEKETQAWIERAKSGELGSEPAAQEANPETSPETSPDTDKPSSGS